MRITRADIANFRCLQDLTISFEDVTVFVGANSTGKSSVLHALSWFFEGGPLTQEDITGHQPTEEITVGVTFTDFDESDKEALGAYVIGEEATFWRTWLPGEKDKITGNGRAYPAFSVVRQHSAAMAKRAAYAKLREERPELELPTVGPLAILSG